MPRQYFDKAKTNFYVISEMTNQPAFRQRSVGSCREFSAAQPTRRKTKQDARKTRKARLSRRERTDRT